MVMSHQENAGQNHYLTANKSFQMWWFEFSGTAINQNCIHGDTLKAE
jgi:hypothetical protein